MKPLFPLLLIALLSSPFAAKGAKYYSEIKESQMLPVELDSPYILISGSNYSSRTKDTIYFQRHSDHLLSMGTSESKLNPVKAHTTTGIVISFKTASPGIQLRFSVLEGENRGHNFAVYQNGAYTDEFTFNAQAGPELTFDINSLDQGNEVFYEITLPNWSITAMTGLHLDSGYDLSALEKTDRPIYVAYGNSITHGTGQSGTHKTYPFLVSKILDIALFNIAVGGSKTSTATAQMLRDDFEEIDIMTMLIGYNDFNGEGIDTIEYRSRYLHFLNTFREVHKNTLIYCISLTYTTNELSVKTGIPADDFRSVVRNIVREFNNMGDLGIIFIEGDEITSEINLKDAVHFTEEGAELFAIELAKILDTSPSRTSGNQADRNEKIKLFPNPNSGKFFIQSAKEIESFKVFSLNGKLLNAQDWHGPSIDLRYLSPGYYILSANYSDNSKSNKVPFCIK